MNLLAPDYTVNIKRNPIEMFIHVPEDGINHQGYSLITFNGEKFLAHMYSGRMDLTVSNDAEAFETLDNGAKCVIEEVDSFGEAVTRILIYWGKERLIRKKYYIGLVDNYQNAIKMFYTDLSNEFALFIKVEKPMTAEDFEKYLNI